MKTTILFFLVAFAAIFPGTAQTIESEKVFGGYRFSQNGVTLNANDLKAQLDTNAESAELLKKARTNNTIATILATAGGAFVGYPLGTALGGGDANWTLAGVGAGLIGVAIPFSSSANKRAREAVDTYNVRINTKENLAFQPQLELTTGAGGLGLALRF